MTPQQRAYKKLSIQQIAIYNLICAAKSLRPTGVQITTCRALERSGLITLNESNEYVLKGEPVAMPVKYQQPRDVILNAVKETVPQPETKHIPMTKVWRRPAAIYDNTSREQHVAKYVKGKVEDIILPVKCLFDFQMSYIVANWEQQAAKDMAEHLKVDVLYVRVFCQLNGFEPPKKKKIDTFHAIPHEKKLRMKRVGYNDQKKTA